MDFELTKSQKEIQKAAKEFAKGEFDKELALELDRTHEFPTKIWKKAADLGFIGVHYPEKYSGQDLGVLENIIIDNYLFGVVSVAKDGTESLVQYPRTLIPRRRQ
jgi:alkylation response protein AidB-like acyl-CoA dehydrogenase